MQRSTSKRPFLGRRGAGARLGRLARRAGLVLALALVPLSGCVPVWAGTGVHLAFRGPPTLVEIGPGVWVVEGYHRPVFFTSGYYWLYDGGWYRTPTWRARWVRVRDLPPVLRRIEPGRYRYYRAARTARRFHAPAERASRGAPAYQRYPDPELRRGREPAPAGRGFDRAPSYGGRGRRPEGR